MISVELPGIFVHAPEVPSGCRVHQSHLSLWHFNLYKYKSNFAGYLLSLCLIKYNALSRQAPVHLLPEVGIPDFSLLFQPLGACCMVVPRKYVARFPKDTECAAGCLYGRPAELIIRNDGIFTNLNSSVF